MIIEHCITTVPFCSMVNGEDINDHHLEKPGYILQQNASLEYRLPQLQQLLHCCIKVLYAGMKGMDIITTRASFTQVYML